MKRSLLQFTRFLILLVLVFGFREMQAQTNGCTLGNFGIDAGLYSGTNENPPPAVTNTTMDWFQGSAGHGIIDETSPATLTSLLQGSGDPTYLRRLKYPKLSTVNSQIMIDAVFARDNFGGTGFIDATSFNTASKNGEDPAIWDPGPQNVLGKNDLIDVAGTMYRDGPLLTNDLYFDGVITRAEPGGDAYMDFEFFIEAITYNPSTGFSSGGPQMGHTAFTFDPTTHAVTKVGDFIYNLSLSGGTVPALEVRLWVSHTDYLSGNHPPGFTWGPNYDGAFTGSPYGYASIIPVAPELCGIVNTPGRTSAAPPWGVKSTKYNSWNTSYSDYSFIELGLNMTHFGIDHASLSGADPCYFPIHTFVVKTRASSSFTAQLKDFAGPYSWGQFSAVAEIVGDTVLSCSHPLVTLIADPVRTDVTYSWTTLDGQIIGSADQSSITTTTPGTYTLQETLIGTLCSTPPHNAIVGWNYTRPPFGTQLSSTTVSCNGTNGSINLTPVGGAPPYTYLWSGPNSFSSTVEDPTGLVPGTYYVTITDAGACTISTAAVVNAATPIVITPGATSTNCYGGTNGTASVAVTGHSPFTYYWSNGNITPSISNLIAGTYTVTVTDADGCTQVSSSISVSQPSAILSPGTTVNVTTSGGHDGSINITSSGGTPTYTYLWSGPNSFSSTLADPLGLYYGAYHLTVTDTHGCIGLAPFFIYEPEICGDGIDNDGNGLTDCSDPACKPAAPGTITPNNASPCLNTTYTYTVPIVAGMTYTWTYPGTSSYVSGQGTNVLSLQWNSVLGGQICVTAATTYGCSSSATCLSVSPHDVPAKPDNIIKN